MLDTENLSLSSMENVAHVIQVALTPVFLLSGIASLLGVFAARLARVADRVDQLSERIETADPAEKERLNRRLAHLRRRSHTLDAAVLLGTAAGVATCAAALVLFVGTLRDRPGGGLLFAAFGLALLFTAGALAAFLIEMLLASRGLRDVSNRNGAARDGDAPQPPAGASAGPDPADRPAGSGSVHR